MPRFKKKLTPEEELEQMEESEDKPKKEIIKKEGEELTIEDLPGIGPKGAQKLREAGYVDLMSIAAASAVLRADVSASAVCRATASCAARVSASCPFSTASA